MHKSGSPKEEEGRQGPGCGMLTFFLAVSFELEAA